MDLGECLIVIDGRIDADPVFSKVDAVDFIHQERLPDVGAAVAHPFNAAQFITGKDGATHHLRVGGAGFAQPVHEEIAFLEGRQQLLPHQRPDVDAPHQQGDRGKIGHTRHLQRAAQEPIIPAMQRRQNRRHAFANRCVGEQNQHERRGDGERNDRRHQRGDDIGLR